MIDGKTERLSANGHTDEVESKAGIERAAEILRSGGTVAFPTETVYGLGANALDESAVAKIFEAKQRPSWDPLIVHVSDREMLERVVSSVPDWAERLIEAFWPGPLTVLLPRTAAVPDAVTAGRPLVGVRMPAHPVASELIRLAGIPIAAPSANRFGHTSPTSAQHVLDDLEGRIDAVLDGGWTEVGVESTVAGAAGDGDGLVIYRPGGVTLEQLVALSGKATLYRPEKASEPKSLPSPGVGIRHYAPKARLVLVRDLFMRSGRLEASLIEPAADAVEAARRVLRTSQVGVMLPDGWDRTDAPLVYPWGPWEDGALLAHRLFSGLRALDEQGAAVIVCPVPQMGGIGMAIRDRLEKAVRAE